MNDEQYGRPRRSTRAQKLGDPSGGVAGDNGAKSRLADGVRNRFRSSNSSHTPKPNTPSGSTGKTGATSKPSNTNQISGSSDAGEKRNRKGKDGMEDRKSKQSNPQKDTYASGNNQSDDTGQSNEAVGNPAKKVKDASSNTTGGDYGKKSTKDQLEHQAADVAMDTTPGLSQFNSARKALKNFNKTKKSAGGGDDGITDKAEEKMDDAVDKGIKGVKVAAGAGVANGVGMIGMAGLLFMKTLMMLKGMMFAVLGKIAGFFGSIFSAVSSFFSGLLGVATAVGQTIAAGFMALLVAGTSILGFGVVQEFKKDDSVVACTPTHTKVSDSSQSYIGSGEIGAIREDHAVKLWSVYSEIGGSKAQTAAVLGNLEAESSLDPTAIETIYNEPFFIGISKQDAIANDFQVELIDPSYADRFPAINYVGIGLAQWTNGRNRLLIDYAKEKGVNWYEFDTQVRFMIDGDSPGRQDQLMDFLNTEPGNVGAETERFMNTWIGLSSPNPSLDNRQSNATDYMFILERATADTDYADSILSGVNVNRSEGNSAAGAYYQDDGCGNPIKSHYGNQAVDGTGEVPSNLTLVPWSRDTLPSSLKEYAKNPEDAGLAWGDASGWANGVIPDQCAALSHSYFIQLYPGWNKDGRATTRPFGDGKDVANKWAAHYGESTVDYPSAGAVFSDATTSQYGHTGIVQHVFANGDILIIEQNIRGVSGEGAGLDYSWSWRVIKKNRYEQASWEFFKPSDAEPQWTTPRV
ncbi:phage tail-type lysozyme domain-containing protein [Virgibacillus sp. AGTR]|uniref:phage tail tip lysozyme n=1 Tax=Virgibacillus sp. AGTR TaxID=2812055 RepID=UPI001D163B3A|nr:phage tail tip lysozyme [Virgibacillus sp. AGTR]MCC2248990.1 phage tail-type lysozyme domain-containing protein [Virgibacillus sp. AGTR]